MERWYVEDIQDDPDNLAIAAGMEWVAQKADELGTGAIVLVPVLRQIEDLERSLKTNRQIARSRGQQFNVSGRRVDVVTHRQAFTYGFTGGPVFVVWGVKKGLNVAEEMRPPVLLALEWNEGELDEWKATWAPTNIVSGKPAAAEEAPAAIVEAIRDLSLSDRDIVHPLDKDQAIDTLKLLLAGGIPIDPATIEAEALRQKWPPSGASRLRDLATKIAEGRRVKGGRSGRISQKAGRDAVAHWQARASDAD